MPTKRLIEKFDFMSDSVFMGLPKEDLAFLESKMVHRKYKKEQRIFVEGSMPTGIYYLKSGKIKKYKADRDGEEQIIYICNSGELLGYPALLSEEPYSDSAAALEDCIVAFIPKDDFLQVLSQSHILSNKLLKNLSHEFGVLLNSIVTFAHRSVRERLALSLLILKDKYRIKGNESKPVEINLSREDLSNLVGTAVETLVRLLHDFKDEGLIETEGRKIRILDVKRLAKVANFY
jgi:CRP-like cAMP-binding protein